MNSIHNDGASLDLKIKEALKWKLEEFTQKVKQKDEKIMHLEVAQTRQDKQFKDTVTAISDATQQEFDKMQKSIDDLTRVIENQKTTQILERETMLHQVTQNIMSNMLPQVDS